MSRLSMLLVALVICLVPAAGCTICQSPEDRAYAAFGGVWERHDPESGRVGSAFEPAEGMVITRGQSTTRILESDDLEMDDEDGEFYYEDYERTQFSR
jgi:hypothetical protein